MPDFAGKVLEVLRSEVLRRRLSEEGLRYVEEWSARAYASRMLSLYHELIRRPAAFASEES